MLFRDELKRLREKVGLTQESLAQKAGTSVGNVRNYEQGIRLPSFPGAVKLAKALGVDCTAFSECEDVAGEETSTDKPAAKKPMGKGGKK
jgi:transcriptional regulator with XRE-family HTH domain